MLLGLGLSPCIPASATAPEEETWLPSSEAGLRLWLQAGVGYWQDTAGTTPATADTTAVARWDDQSGNGYHVTQVTANKRPLLRTSIINGQSVLRFDGSNDCLQGTTLSNLIANSAFSWFALVRPTAAATNNANTYQNTAMIGESGQVWGAYLKSTPAVHVYNWDGSDDNVSKSITLSTAFVLHWRHDSGNLVISKDGGSETSAASGNTTPLTGTFTIGARDATNLFMTGDICEVFGYNVALGATAITNGIAYLKTLGGIA